MLSTGLFELDRLLKTHFRIYGKIKYHDDGLISVDGNVELFDSSITYLPVRFRKISGYFHCDHTNLISLEGSPQVCEYFSFNDTKIISLKGGPKKVGTFWCNNTKITNLEGSPQEVSGNFNCVNTKITSLEGAPESVRGNFYCRNTPFYDQFFVDENTQISAVKYLPRQFIQLLNDRNIRITQSVQIIAVDTDPTVIKWIDNPTRMAQLTAVKKNSSVIEYIKNPDPLVHQYLSKSK